jgi:hypothetical protein
MRWCEKKRARQRAKFLSFLFFEGGGSSDSREGTYLLLV